MRNNLSLLKLGYPVIFFVSNLMTNNSYGSASTAAYEVEVALNLHLRDRHGDDTAERRELLLMPDLIIGDSGISLRSARSILKEHVKNRINGIYTEFEESLIREIRLIDSDAKCNSLLFNLFVNALWKSSYPPGMSQSLLTEIGNRHQLEQIWTSAFNGYDYAKSVVGICQVIDQLHIIPVVNAIKVKMPVICHRAHLESSWVGETSEDPDPDAIRAEILNTLEAVMELHEGISQKSKENAQSICTYLGAIVDVMDDRAALMEEVRTNMDTCLLVLLLMKDELAVCVPEVFEDDETREKVYSQDWDSITDEIRPTAISIMQKLLTMARSGVLAGRDPGNSISDTLSAALKSFRDLGVMAVRNRTQDRDNVFYALDQMDGCSIISLAEKLIMHWEEFTHGEPDGAFQFREEDINQEGISAFTSLVEACMSPMRQQVLDFHNAYTKAVRFGVFPYFCREVWPQKRHCHNSLGALFAEFIERLFYFKEAKKQLDIGLPDLNPYHEHNTTRIAGTMQHQGIDTIFGHHPNVFPESIAKNLLYWYMARLYMQFQNSDYQELLGSPRKTIEDLMNTMSLQRMIQDISAIPTDLVLHAIGQYLINKSEGATVLQRLQDTITYGVRVLADRFLFLARFSRNQFVTDGYQVTTVSPFIYAVQATDSSRRFLVSPGQSSEISYDDLIFELPLGDTLETDGIAWLPPSRGFHFELMSARLVQMIRSYYFGTILPSLSE
ncbi:MAG: hypothetical protein LBF65_02280 [Holosporales bacterium]|jgi:hypothetical protein|nr:hypothetical protein [Holosporales bacterium]